MYAGRVEVALQASALSQWTRYTTDGSEPSEGVGMNYLPGHPIVIEKSTVLKFRSKDLAGNVEPVKVAQFEITPPAHELTFFNDPLKSGYVKGDANGHLSHVGTLRNFVLGIGKDGLDNRAVLHFDTAALPDNAVITRAHLELDLHPVQGKLAGLAPIQLDVGNFSSSRALNAQAWDAKLTAEGVATFARAAAQRATPSWPARCSTRPRGSSRHHSIRGKAIGEAFTSIQEYPTGVSGSSSDEMSDTITIEDGGNVTTLSEDEMSMTPAFSELLEWLKALLPKRR